MTTTINNSVNNCLKRSKRKTRERDLQLQFDWIGRDGRCSILSGNTNRRRERENESVSIGNDDLCSQAFFYFQRK
jgi:hypothetical protein